MKLALTLLSLFTLLTLYSQENINQKDHISIIHIGSTDKFIYAINISKDSLTDDFAVTDGLYGNKTHLMARNYIVNNEVYDKIKKSILTKEKKNQSIQGNIGEIEFQINPSEGDQVKYVLRINRSKKLLNLLINELEDEQDTAKLIFAFTGVLANF